VVAKKSRTFPLHCKGRPWARYKLLSFNNVQATGLANVDLDGLKGTTIERIVLQLGGTTFTKSMLTSIQPS
jgi:hypothetical protein